MRNEKSKIKMQKARVQSKNQTLFILLCHFGFLSLMFNFLNCFER